MGKITFKPKRSVIIKYRKEKGFFEQYSLISFDNNDGFNEVLTLRLYVTGTVYYAVVWADNVRQKDTGGMGGGRVSGFGYNKKNAATDEAFINAGFKFTDHKTIESEGIEKILGQIAKDVYDLKNFYILNAHA